MKDLTVIISACGAQFMPGLSDCLKFNGERNIRIIGVDSKQDRTVLSFVDDFFLVPQATDDNYVDSLIEICKKEHVDVILPFMSSELIPIIDRMQEFNELGVKVSVSNKKSVEIANNKYKFYSFIRECGISVPKFVHIKDAKDLRGACFECGYPQNGVCVKATELSGSRGIRIILPNISRYDILFNEKPNSYLTTLEELESILYEKEIIPDMMAMEYLPGLEGSVDLLANNGEVIYMAYRESNVNLHSIPQMATLKYNEEAYDISRKVIKALNFTGNADLDFKNDKDGHPILMELNPRIAATMKIFKMGGLNLPYLRIKQLIGEDLPEINVNYGIVMKRKYLECFTDINNSLLL